jgi:hypothetical protein
MERMILCWEKTMMEEAASGIHIHPVPARVRRHQALKRSVETYKIYIFKC